MSKSNSAMGTFAVRYARQPNTCNGKLNMDSLYTWSRLPRTINLLLAAVLTATLCECAQALTVAPGYRVAKLSDEQGVPLSMVAALQCERGGYESFDRFYGYHRG